MTDPAEEYCYDCTRQKHLFVDGRSLWVHKDAVENAVYAMKYQNRRIYGQTFGKEMAEHFSFLSMGKKDHLDRAGSAAFPAKKKAGI